MNSIKKTLLSLVLLSAMMQTFAVAIDECPPLGLIKQTQFSKAYPYVDEYSFILFSNPFQFNNREWNVTFLITGYENAESALVAGQKYFSSKIHFIPAKREKFKNELRCLYSPDNQFTVAALSPPFPN